MQLISSFPYNFILCSFVYSESIFREALQAVGTSIKVNEIWIKNIRYAEDTVIIADNMGDLQHHLTAGREHSEILGGLNINTKKLSL